MVLKIKRACHLTSKTTILNHPRYDIYGIQKWHAADELIPNNCSKYTDFEKQHHLRHQSLALNPNTIEMQGLHAQLRRRASQWKWRKRKVITIHSQIPKKRRKRKKRRERNSKYPKCYSIIWNFTDQRCINNYTATWPRLLRLPWKEKGRQA